MDNKHETKEGKKEGANLARAPKLVTDLFAIQPEQTIKLGIAERLRNLQNLDRERERAMRGSQQQQQEAIVSDAIARIDLGIDEALAIAERKRTAKALRPALVWLEAGICNVNTQRKITDKYTEQKFGVTAIIDGYKSHVIAWEIDLLPRNHRNWGTVQYRRAAELGTNASVGPEPFSIVSGRRLIDENTGTVDSAHWLVQWLDGKLVRDFRLPFSRMSDALKFIEQCTAGRVGIIREDVQSEILDHPLLRSALHWPEPVAAFCKDLTSEGVLRCIDRVMDKVGLHIELHKLWGPLELRNLLSDHAIWRHRETSGFVLGLIRIVMPWIVGSNDEDKSKIVAWCSLNTPSTDLPEVLRLVKRQAGSSQTTVATPSPSRTPSSTVEHKTEAKRVAPSSDTQRAAEHKQDALPEIDLAHVHVLNVASVQENVDFFA